MNTEQIQQMRALLAAQPPMNEAQNASLGRRLKALLARKALQQTTPPALDAVPLFDPEETRPAEEDAPLILGVDNGAAESVPPAQPIPPELLLSGIAPRRPAFGQRAEPVLELQQPAPSASQRLTLLGADGAAVGEIILQGAPALAPANDPLARRPFEPLHSEVPFFPDDLADEPPAQAPRMRLKPKRFEATPPQPERAAAAPPELAAAFLLATLAARLASEEATLGDRLAEALAA